VLFHARRVAEERLRGAARRMAHVTESRALDDMLVREPYEALGLTSCALFRRVDHVFARVAQRGWANDALPVLDANDDLSLELIATRLPVDVERIGWAPGAALATLRPSLAYPILVRQEAVGLLLLGAKRDGERFDGLERGALQTLVESAATTYDHLDAVEQRRLAADLRDTVDELRRENDALRELQARAAPTA
jgi:hypothetical protein